MYEYVTHRFSMGYDSKPIKVSDVEISDLVHQLSQNNFRVTNAQALTQETKVFQEDDIKQMKSGTFEKDKNKVDKLEKYIIKGDFSVDDSDIDFKIILSNHDQFDRYSKDSVYCTVKGESRVESFISKHLPNLTQCLQKIYDYDPDYFDECDGLPGEDELPF